MEEVLVMEVLELSLQSSFTTFCFKGTHYDTSSAATLSVKNINGSSSLEIQDNDSISGKAFKNSSK